MHKNARGRSLFCSYTFFGHRCLPSAEHASKLLFPSMLTVRRHTTPHLPTIYIDSEKNKLTLRRLECHASDCLRWATAWLCFLVGSVRCRSPARKIIRQHTHTRPKHAFSNEKSSDGGKAICITNVADVLNQLLELKIVAFRHSRARGRRKCLKGPDRLGTRKENKTFLPRTRS